MKAKIIDVSEINYAWAAGVLEGEGTFSKHKRKGRNNTISFAIHCEMTDRDIIERLKKIFGVGTICKRDRNDGKRKISWCWSVQNHAGIFEVLLRIRPYLGERRGEKVSEIIEDIERKVLGD